MAKVIQEYANIIKTKKKGVVSIAYHQGQVFKKFKERKMFINLVSQLAIHKITIIFIITVFKLGQKYPKLLTSSTGLRFFQIYHKDIKTVCKKN